MEVMNDERTLTELDHARLLKLVQQTEGDPHAAPIGAALEAASCVPSRSVDPAVVTMNSRVLLADLATGQTRELTLCYPAEARPADGLVSVLSPVGTSLIGLRIGDVARWRTPDGKEGAARVAAVLFQPEAGGHYTL